MLIAQTRDTTCNTVTIAGGARLISENYEPYGRVQGSNVAIRGGWPTEQAYASQPGNINGMARQRPF